MIRSNRLWLMEVCFCPVLELLSNNGTVCVGTAWNLFFCHSLLLTQLYFLVESVRVDNLSLRKPTPVINCCFVLAEMTLMPFLIASVSILSDAVCVRSSKIQFLCLGIEHCQWDLKKLLDMCPYK